MNKKQHEHQFWGVDKCANTKSTTDSLPIFPEFLHDQRSTLWICGLLPRSCEFATSKEMKAFQQMLHNLS